MKAVTYVAGLGLAAVAAARWLTAGPGLAEDLRVLAEGAALSASIEARSAAARRCAAGKEEVIAELAAGRLSLGEAAERFGRLEAQREELPEGRGRLYDDVLVWVANSPVVPAGQREELLARLQRERAAAARRPVMAP